MATDDEPREPAREDHLRVARRLAGQYQHAIDAGHSSVTQERLARAYARFCERIGYDPLE